MNVFFKDLKSSKGLYTAILEDEGTGEKGTQANYKVPIEEGQCKTIARLGEEILAEVCPAFYPIEPSAAEGLYFLGMKDKKVGEVVLRKFFFNLVSNGKTTEVNPELMLEELPENAQMLVRKMEGICVNAMKHRAKAINQQLPLFQADPDHTPPNVVGMTPETHTHAAQYNAPGFQTKGGQNG